MAAHETRHDESSRWEFDLSFGVATDPSQRVPVLQRMIANNSIQQHIVCVSLSLVVCVSVLSVCSRVSCGFCRFGWGGGGCCWWAVAGCWCLASLRVRVSLCLLVPSFVLLLMCSLSLCVMSCVSSRLVSSCLVLSCVLSCLVLCVVLWLCCVLCCVCS